ncbi:SRPBCC family protein [Streptomyces sp. NPDC002643]
MEHEVFVPVSVDRLREALSDPERVARAVPGLQQDAGTTPVAGRLKVRIAGHTITYRGTLHITAADDGTYAVQADAAESRGTGSAKLALTLRLIPATEGTTLAVTGTTTAEGRLTELPEDAVRAAGERLMAKFADNVAKSVAAEEEAKADADAARPVAESPGAAADEKAADGDEEAADGDERGVADDERGVGGPGVGDDEAVASLFEAELSPSSPDPFAEDDFEVGGEPPAEAAHARRTMIGRSAEEVDHAPPRGRYAPVPAPETVSARTTLRWAAPAAALVVASAVIVGRALRRRR